MRQVFGAIFRAVAANTEVRIGIVPLGRAAHLALMQGVRFDAGNRTLEFAAALDELTAAREHGMGEAGRRAS